MEKPDPRAAATFSAFRLLLASRPAEWGSIESACRTFGITPAYACRPTPIREARA